MNTLIGSALPSVPDLWTPTAGAIADTETIEFVRRLVDIDLGEEGVMQLADFLNENRVARHSWPGKPLFDFLKDMFTAGGGIGDVQINATKEALVKTEREYSLFMMPQLDLGREVRVDTMWIEDLKLPEARAKTQVTDVSSRNLFDVDLTAMSCSCAAWYGNRRQFKDADARRCCPHLAQVYAEEISAMRLTEFPRMFSEVITDLVSRREGFDHRCNWRLLRIQMRPFLVGYGNKLDWCEIYALDAERKVQRFELHRTEYRWRFARHPQGAAAVTAYVKSLE